MDEEAIQYEFPNVQTVDEVIECIPQMDNPSIGNFQMYFHFL